MDAYADDLSALMEALDFKDAILVGPIPPLMLQTPANPGGLPIQVFDELRDGVSKDRSQFYKDLSAPFHGANRPEAQVSQGVRDAFWLWCMQAGLKGSYDCIKAFSETDPHRRPEGDRRPTLIPWVGDWP